MRQEYPRAVAILELSADVAMTSWRDVYTVTSFEPKQRMQSISRTPWTGSTPSSSLSK